ncbi:MAG TPA: hypothetical protein VIT88_15135 [Pyrinomonadaceae bacterium]
MLKTIYLLLISLFVVTSAYAQSGRPTNPTGSRTASMQVELPGPVAETPVPLMGGGGGQMQTLSFTTPDASFDRKIVKGAPFSAESVTEHVQPLADGNRMVRKSSAKIYRDAAGRTRREHETSRAPVQPDGQPARLIVITDPVSRVNYLIETHTRTARKRQLPPARITEAMDRARGDNPGFSVLMPTSAVRRREAQGDAAPPPAKPVREKLGAQIVEGVSAEGTRTTLTIPAGEFDNEQPMVITHEEWYAPELQMIVLMKHNDPRFGETTFKLSNILRGEPAPELFEPPVGYSVVDAWEPDIMRSGRRPRTP